MARALGPDGVAAVAGGVVSFVLWDSIDEVDAVHTVVYVRGMAIREPFVGINVTDRDQIEMSRAEKAFMSASRLLAADVAYPVRTLDVNPVLLLESIRYYWKHPDARRELESEEGIRRMSKLSSG